LPLSLF